MLVQPLSSSVVRKSFREKLKFVFNPGGAANGVGFSDRLLLTFFLEADSVRCADPKRPEDKKLMDILERLAQKENIATPRLIIYDSEHPNAASMMISGHIAVANSLSGGRTEAKLEAVLGHEVAHHNHRLRDAAIGWGAPLVAAIAYGATISRKLHKKLSSRIAKFGLHAGETVAGFGAAAVYRSALARSNEFEADREGAMMTGKPCELVEVLDSLAHKHHKDMQEFGSAPPPRERSFVEGLLDTHPPVEERIKHLGGERCDLQLPRDDISR